MLFDRSRIEQALPGYTLGEQIGRGGWGVVFEARQEALGRDVVIKLLPAADADDDALGRFGDEARIVAGLDHPHIVRVHDFRNDGDLWMIVMELLPGGTLLDRFHAAGVPSDQAVVISVAVCAALHVAHGRGILHRDVKPDNVLFTGDSVPRLADFGVAQLTAAESRRTAAGSVIGTPAYMSPEQARGDHLTAASDVYSAAVLLYELLAGATPFPTATSPTEQLLAHIQERPVPLATSAPDIPRLLADAVMTGLEKDPADRYGGAQAFGVALARAAGEIFGRHWLADSGIRLMAGGAIEAAAQRGPTLGLPAVRPTVATPAPVEPRTTPGPQPPTPGSVTPQPATSPGPPTPAPAGPPTPPPSTARPPPSTAPPGPEEPPPEPVPVPAATDDEPANGTSRRLRIGLGVALVLVLLYVIGTRNQGDDGESITASSTTAATDSPTTAPDTTEATSSTTTALVRECPAGTRCAFIDSIGINDEMLIVEWTAMNFTPRIAENEFHVHFYWDIYSNGQVGTNNGEFGVARGAWELTDQQPFIAESEMLPTNRPGSALNICVTVADFSHGVDDVEVFDCVPIPEY